MNQKELNEIRRRFRLEKNNISKVYGCYVNSTKQIISYVDAPVALMRQEEQEMYLTLLKKALSGSLGKNLVDIRFSTRQVADSDEHRLLQALRSSALEDREARETLYQKIIDTVDLGESSYLILLGADAYDVPHRGSDDELQDDASDQVFHYFVCSVCPVKAPTLELRFFHEENAFHSASTGNIVAPPVTGFLYPAFDNREANIYDALLYSKDAKELPEAMIDGVFRVEAPMSAAEQKNVFDETLAETLQEECSYDVVQSVHEQIRGRIEEHKETHDPEPLDLSIEEVGGILASSGVSGPQVEAFQAACEERYGDSAAMDPKNIIDSRKFEVHTPEVKISVAPENSYLIETRVIDGRKYLLIPADEGVEVNGIGVTITEN